jgi:hypothetical protein
MTEHTTEMPGGWHLDKRVSVGHIVTTAIVMVSMVAYAIKQEARIDNTIQQIEFNKERIGRLERDYRRDIEDIKALLARIDSKIDNKADKR